MEVYGIQVGPQETEEVKLSMRKLLEQYPEKEGERRGKYDYVTVLMRCLTNIEVGIMLFLCSRFYICVSHRRKMKAIRRSLKKYLEKKLEELMGMTDDKMDDFGIRK